MTSLVDQRGGATVALAPILCADRESEVPAARQLLARLDRRGSLVSLEAGHANRVTAATVIDQDGEDLPQRELRRVGVTASELDFPHAGCVLALTCETFQMSSGKTSARTRLFVCSLPPGQSAPKLGFGFRRVR